MAADRGRHVVWRPLNRIPPAAVRSGGISPGPGRWWLATLRSREVLWSALIVSALGLLAAGVAIYHHHRVPYHVGEVVQDTVLSRVEFKAVPPGGHGEEPRVRGP